MESSAGPIVKKNLPVIESRAFDKGQRASDQISKHPNKEANTHWNFHCTPSFDYEFEAIGKTANKPAQVKIKIGQAKVEIGLDITTWLPEGASPKVIAHEAGHRKIALNEYDRAEKFAEQACKHSIGKSYDGSGENEEEAIRSAIEQASQDLCRLYRSRTVDVVNIVSDNYDRLTEHSNNSIAEDDAIAKAYELYRKKTPLL